MRILIAMWALLLGVANVCAEGLGDTFVGPAYGSDDAAVAALVAEFKDTDLVGMREVWSRMQPAQKITAYEAIREWLSDLEDDELERVDAGYQLLRQVDWSALHAEVAAIRETEGLTFGNLRGVVVDENSNQPVEGLTINAIHTEHGMGVKMMTSKTTDVTDAEGRFELTHIPTGELNLGGLKSSHVMQGASATIIAGQTTEVKLTARPLGNIRVAAFIAGAVVDAETGQPILGASVFLDKRVKRTPGHGRFLFDTTAGTYQMRVEHRDYHPASAEVTAPASGGVRHDFELRPITTGTITGVAVDKETGRIIANVTINVGGQVITTDAQGRFQVAEVESGDVAVRAESSGYKASTETVVLAARATTNARLELEAIKVGEVAGVVTDASTGAPLAGVSVTASGVTATSDELGQFRLSGVPVGKVSVLAAKAVYENGTTEATVPPGDLAEVSLALRPITYGTVQVTVTDAQTGAALADAEVEVAGIISRTDSLGSVTREGVAAGDVAIAANRAAFRPANKSMRLDPAATLAVALALEPIVIGGINGIAVDATTQTPLAGVAIAVDGHRTETGTDGRFELTGVNKGKATLTANKAAFRDTSLPVEVLAAAVIKVRITLEPITTGRIRGRVIDAVTQQPLGGAHVSLHNQAITVLANGQFEFAEIPAGVVSVNASKPVYIANAQQIEVRPAETAELTIALKPVTTGDVAGVVVNAHTGEPIADATVAVGGQGGRSYADGSFAIASVPAGEHALSAQKARYEPKNVRAIVTAAGQAKLKIELVPITYGTIEGQVLNAISKAPLINAAVRAGGLSATTDAQGRFSIERIPAGSINLVAQKPVFETWQRTLDLEAAATHTLAIELDPITYGTVVGTVVDADTGQPLGEVTVSVGGHTLSTNADGRFRVEKVDSGNVLVAGEKPKYLGKQTQVEIQPGTETEVRLALDPVTTGRVEGVVIDAKTRRPIAGARVSLREHTAEAGADGRFSFEVVRSGELQVAARHADYADGSAAGRLEPAEALHLTVELELRREDVAELEKALATRGSIDLYGIHFDSGKDKFRSSSLGTLHAVLTVMERAPDRHFLISGHTDSDGSDMANQDLSERRARTVIDWLVGKGIVRERLKGVGYGESKPAAPNDTHSGKALNRRVQLSYEN